MKIVQIEDFFHPDAGYQINILSKYMAYEGHDVTIITSKMEQAPDELRFFFDSSEIIDRDNYYIEKYGVDIIRLSVLGFFSSRAIFFFSLIKKIKLLNPDVLFLHGNDTFSSMLCLMLNKYLNCKIILDSHMLEMASINRFSRVFKFWYRKLFTPIIVKNSLHVIRTQNDQYVIKELGVPVRLAPWISYGSDTLLFYPSDEIKLMMREKLDISKESFVVIYAGKISDSKGLLFFANAIQEKYQTKVRDLVFIIIGNADSNYGKTVEDVLSESENRIIRLSTQKYEDLAKYYQLSDLCIFPKQCSLSFYDAQACGLPVLSENNNINIERNSNGNGMCFISNSSKDLRGKIIEFADMDDYELTSYKESALSFILNNYNYSEKAKEYINLIEKTFKG